MLPTDPTDDDLKDEDPNNPISYDDLPMVDDKKHQKVKPPSVVGEENVFSGDATTSEPANIDEELAKVGLSGDDHDGTPDPLGVGSEIDSEDE